MTDVAVSPVIEVAGQRYGATMSSDEAATLFGCSPKTLRSARGTGRLPIEPLPFGSKLRWATIQVAEAVDLEWRFVENGR